MGHSTPAEQSLHAPTRVFADVLCAVDGSRGSRAAVEQAANLAGPAGRLTLLAVVGLTGAGRFQQAAISPARAAHILDGAAAIADRAGVAADKLVDEAGPAAEAILRRAGSHDLLAIGAPVIGWLAGPLSGAVGDAALARCEVPLLAARPLGLHPTDGRLFPDHVLVASEGAIESDPVVELAARIAREREARLTYLHAVGVESQERPAHVQAQIERLHAAFDGALQTRIEAAPAREAILSLAQANGASLIVMGSRRRHEGLRALGSASRRVAHEAPCSVLLVPPGSTG